MTSILTVARTYQATPSTGDPAIPGNRTGPRVVVEADQVPIAAVQGRVLAQVNAPASEMARVLAQDLALAQDLVLAENLALAHVQAKVQSPRLARDPRLARNLRLAHAQARARSHRLSAAAPSVTIVAASALQIIASVENRAAPAVQVAVPAALQAAHPRVVANVGVGAEDVSSATQ